ncbi:electron transporter RnfC [Pseudodesulfovibrio sp. zrk46]|uniref:electron transporter RnfC n=1 Tax=Pseudodesulfovibrio sp. zrk46 TaxID=2725288 RepID=UPI00144903E8|nr:electron transporter RnfC [Pseudodesulfovibrio sp. zrk46]QJB57478.1 electron transporter RnfC [Pseudodesulfovibrio sp. zrk46]
MLKIHYNLDSDLNNEIADIIPPAELNVQVRNLVLKTKKGKKVATGETIAEHPSAFGGAFHASASGKVMKVNYHHMTIKCDGEESTVEPVDVLSMGTGKELLRTLQGLGVDVAPLSGRADVLVINGLNPEPGVSVAQQLLKDCGEYIQAGLDLAKKLITPGRTVLAVAKGDNSSLSGAETVSIKPKYPASLDALVVREVTGKEFPADTKVMSVMDLHDLGRVAMTGKPIMDTIMTIDGRNYRVPLGTPIRHLMECTGLKVQSGDIVVLGGPFQGESVYSLDEGVKKEDYGLFIIASATFPAVQDAACINCGECVLQCPARVQPHLISRYAEYEMFEHAEKCGLNSCFECGLCSFNCFSRRPLLQYIRFAKAQLQASGQGEQA